MRLHYNGVACGDMNVVMKYLENGIEKIDTFYKEQNDFIIAGGYQVINPGVMLIATNGSCIDSTFFMANPIQCNKYHKVYVNYTSCGARVTDYWYTNSCDPGDMYFYMDGINNNIHIFTVGSGAAGGAGNIPDGIYQVYRADQMCTSGSKLITISGATWVAPNNLTASQVGTMQTVKLKWKSNNIVFSETFGFQIQVKMQNDTTWQEYNYPGGYPYNQKLFNFNIDNIVSDSVYEFRIRTDWYNAGLWSPVQTFCIGSNCSSARTAVEEDNMEANPLLLTPSPASNSINISIPDNDEALNQITVYDQIGNVVIKKLIQEGNNAITLDLSSITNGVYLVVVSTDTTTYSKKFVVIK
jgi:hypothetical protein